MDRQRIMSFRSWMRQAQRAFANAGRFRWDAVNFQQNIGPLMEELQRGQDCVKLAHKEVEAVYETLPSDPNAVDEDGNAIKVRSHRRSKPAQSGRVKKGTSEAENYPLATEVKPDHETPAGRSSDRPKPGD